MARKTTRRALLGNYRKKASKSRKTAVHRKQIQATTGGRAVRAQRAVAAPNRSFLSFNANQPPKNLYASLKSSEYANLTYAAWTQTVYPNSAFDPTGTFGSGKPRYFATFLGGDNTASLYRKYRVHGAYVSVDVTNLQSSPILFGIATYKNGTTGPSAVTNLEEARTRSDTRTMIIPSAQAGGSTKKMVIDIKCKDILGYKDLADDDATGAQYDANPNHLIACQIFIMPLDGSDINIEANVSVQIFQKCQFFELNDVAST